MFQSKYREKSWKHNYLEIFKEEDCDKSCPKSPEDNNLIQCQSHDHEVLSIAIVKWLMSREVQNQKIELCRG